MSVNDEGFVNEASDLGCSIGSHFQELGFWSFEFERVERERESKDKGEKLMLCEWDLFCEKKLISFCEKLYLLVVKCHAKICGTIYVIKQLRLHNY